MDFTPVCFTEYDNNKRVTGNGAELALAVLFLSGVQHYAETAQGMSTVPDYVRTMMREIPVSWDESIFIDGYPGKYIVLARRSGNDWYVAGVNAEKDTLRLNLNLPFAEGISGTIIAEGETLRSFSKDTITPDYSGNLDINVQPGGGFVIKFTRLTE
jgi:hypothetical protein